MLALPVRLNPSGAYVIDLHATWVEFYQAKRSSATRRGDRTKRKRLGAQYDARRFNWIGTLATYPGVMFVASIGACPRLMFWANLAR